MSTFTIKAAPNTDIWRKPPTTDSFNAPTSVPPGQARTTGPLSSFRSARTAFAFSPSEQYDQAGLLLSLRRRTAPSTSSTTSTSPPSKPDKWIKTGVEYYYAKPLVSTVSCDNWADWSVAPLSGDKGTADGVTIEVVAEGDDKGRSFWVYQIVGGEKVPLREICWVAAKQEEWELSVEAMAARPEAKAKDELSVEFREFDVQWAN